MTPEQCRYAAGTDHEVYRPSGAPARIVTCASDRVRVAYQLNGRTKRRWYRPVDLAASSALRTAPGYPDGGSDTYRWSFSDESGTILDGQPLYAEDDAVHAVAWGSDPTGSVVLSLIRQRPGALWRIDSSDGPIEVTWYSKPFRSPDDAVAFIAGRWGMELAERDLEW